VSPYLGILLLSVTHSQHNTRPTVTFPVSPPLGRNQTILHGIRGTHETVFTGGYIKVQSMLITPNHYTIDMHYCAPAPNRREH